MKRLIKRLAVLPAYAGYLPTLVVVDTLNVVAFTITGKHMRKVTRLCDKYFAFLKGRVEWAKA